MRRFTLTIALIAIVAFAFGQRAVEQAQFTQKSPFANKTLKQYQGEKSTNLTIVWSETFDDSIAAGVNGLPTNFAYTPNSTEIKDQWQYKGTSPDGYIGRGWYADIAIDEQFTTDAHTVPTNNPALFVDFTNSFYWMIEQGSDSLEILYSIDGGSSYTRLWSNRDQALVEASGVDYPYPNWVWQTARISLPLTTIGQDMSFKFIFRGGTANGIYVDNIMMVEIPDNDIEASATCALNQYLSSNDTMYLDGVYQLLPISQKRDFTYLKSAVKNYGMVAANNIVFSTTLTDGSGTVVAQKDTNEMFLGTDLTNFLDKDTFLCNGFDNIDAVTVGTYTLQQSVTYDNVDEDTTNNYWSMDIEYVADGAGALLARNTSMTGALGLHQYDGSADGDQIGIDFTVSNECTMTGAMIPLGSSTTDNSGFTLKLYTWDNTGNSWQQIAFSDDVYTSAADASTTIDVDLLTPATLTPGESYKMVAAAHWTAGTSEITFSVFKGYKDFQDQSLLYAPASALNIGGTWYYITNVPSMIVKLNTETSVEVYPNPTNGTLHIDNVNGATVEVYNMVGTMVDVINNASDFNTVNLSNYAEGTYLVKVYTEEGVVVKKVNLVK